MSTAQNPSTESTASDESGAVSERRFGLRARAIVVGIPLVIAMCIISVYADMVTKTVQFGVLQLAPPAIVGLFLLAGLNRLLSRVLRRELLNSADLAVVYMMLLVGVMISTRGLVEKMIPPLTYLQYHSSPVNHLNDLITSHLPKWLLPFEPSPNGSCPDGLRAYYEGLHRGETIPWSAWVGPLCAAFSLAAMVLWCFACVSTLLRRQWMDNERLSFPLTTLPLAIIRNQINGQSFIRNPAMWAGFSLAVIVFTVNGIQANNPTLPHFILNFPITPLLTERPWNSMDAITLYISLAAVGFAFFLPSDLLFSLWFFFLLTRLQDVITVDFGGIPKPIGTHNAHIFNGYQAAGGYFVMIISYVMLGKGYFRDVWRTAFGKSKPLDDSGELMTYRTAIIGLLLGFLGIVAWLSYAGMSPWLAAVIMGIYMFVTAVIMTRAVNEAGLLITETSFLPSHVVGLVYPIPDLGAVNNSLMGVTNTMFARDLRGVMLSPLMDTQKIAGELRLKQRALLAPFGIAVVIAAVVASAFFLYLSYMKGHINLYSYPDSGNAGGMYTLASAAIKGNYTPPDNMAYGGFFVGIVVTIILVRLRTLLPWFPLHPLAYVIAPTWAMFVLWFPCFIAWTIKIPVMRYGGMGMYRKFQPFMLGLILGEFTMAVLWAILAAPAIGLSAPEFPWP